MGIIGNLNNLHGELKFEWEIKDFLMLSDINNRYKSPQFSFYGSSWELWIHPNGQINHESLGYIDLYLRPVSLFKPVTVDMTFNFKTDYRQYNLEKQLTYFFENELCGHGVAKFISRSGLIRRKLELLPSKTLTVILSLKISETNKTAKNTFQDAFVQTERTGVWKLQQHLRDISQNGEISDIVLKVKDQEFKSHRCILAARSPVFSAMMKTEMKENVTGVVDIQDIDPKVFSDFLSYLYTGSTEGITSENVTKLYTAADKYQVEVLKENCVDHMIMNVSIENFCDIFIISVQYNEEKLKKTCIQYFVKHSLEIVKTCNWQSFLSENPIISNELFIKYIELNKNM